MFFHIWNWKAFFYFLEIWGEGGGIPIKQLLSKVFSVSKCGTSTHAATFSQTTLLTHHQILEEGLKSHILKSFLYLLEVARLDR